MSPSNIQWSEQEQQDALLLSEDVFLSRYPHRTVYALKRKVESLLGGETYGQFRNRQAIATHEERIRDAWEQHERDVAGPRAPVSVTPEPTNEEWETFFRHLEEADAAKGLLSPTQQSTEFRAPDDGLPVAVAFTGDWHCGAGGVRYDWLRRDLDIIAATDGLYAIGMGDWLEGVNVNVKAASALYSGLFNEGGFQEKYVISRAATAKGKWLAILSGNHDEWIYRTAGVTRMDEFARLMNASHFGEGGGTVFANVGSQRYAIGVRHNAAGNSQLNTSNAQRRAFDSWPEWDNLHVICLAHLHFCDLHVPPRRGGRCVYLRSGTYKTRDHYAASHGYVPEWGVPLTILLPDEERVIAWRGDDFLEAVRYFVWLRRMYAERTATNSGG